MRFESNIVFWVAALVVIVALLWLLSPILLPFVLGMAIAYVLDPLANQLSKRGAGRSLAVALAQFAPDGTRIVIVAGIVLFGQFLEGNVLAPKLVSESVRLHPVWLMFALFAFGYLFGFVGLLLAVPLAAGAGVLIRFALARYLASPLYTGNRPL